MASLRPYLYLVLGLAVSMMAPVRPAVAVQLSVVYTDGAGEGFFDEDLGLARRSALEFALGIWSSEIEGDLPILVEAQFNPLGGSAFGAVLASAGPQYFVDDPPNAPVANTTYSAAQANFLAGGDLNTSALEIFVQANSDVDGEEVLGTISWYYGTDANPPGNDVDFVTTILHEMGHGLGFLDLIDQFSGQFLFGLPDIYSRQLTSPGVGDLDQISAQQRLGTLTSGNLFWKGSSVVNEAGGQVPMYAPFPYQNGSSISHWDTSNTPDLLMEPFDTGPKHDVDLTRNAFLDIGWGINGLEPPDTTPTPGPTPETGNKVLFAAQPESGKILVMHSDTGEVFYTLDPPEDAPLDPGNTEIGLAYGYTTHPSLFYCNANSSPGFIYELDPTTGEVLSEVNPAPRQDLSENFDFLNPYNGLGFIRGDFTTDRGILIASTSSGNLSRIELLTGDERNFWNIFGDSGFSTGFFPTTGAVAGDDAEDILAIGFSFFGFSNGVYSINPATSVTPEFQGSVPSTLIEGMAFDGDTLFASDSNGRLYQLNARTGLQRQPAYTVVGGDIYALAVTDQFRPTPLPSATVTRRPTSTPTPTSTPDDSGPLPSPTPLGENAFAVGDNPVWVATGDLDGASREDIVTANHDGNSLSILYNDGFGGFEDLQTLALGGGTKPTYVAVGDLDGNGLNDLFVLAAGTNQVFTIENLGNRTYGPPVAFNIPVSRPVSAFIGDLNGDDLYDLVVANSQTDNLTVAINPGGVKGLLVDNTQVQIYPTGGQLPSSVTGGVLRPFTLALDLVTANFEDGTLSILYGNGDGTFQPAQVHPAGINPRHVNLTDVDGSGIPEIVICNQGAPQLSTDFPGSLLIYLDPGLGSFGLQDAVTILPGNHPVGSVGIDIDLDCDADLAVVNFGRPPAFSKVPEPGDLAFILSSPAQEGMENNTLVFDSQQTVGFRPLSLAVGAFEGDRRDDLVVANQQDDTVGVILFHHENPPCNLTCDTNGDGVCDQLDFLLLSAAGSKEDPRLREVGDLNSDGVLNSEDILEFIKARQSPPAGQKTLLSLEAPPAAPAKSDGTDVADLNGDGIVDYLDAFPGLE